MRRRFIEIVVVGFVVAFAQALLFKPPVQEGVRSPELDRRELNISGVYLGMSLKEVEAAVGSPPESSHGEEFVFRPVGDAPLRVIFGTNATVEKVVGYHLSANSDKILDYGVAAGAWSSLLGEVQPESPKTDSRYLWYHYPTLSLSIVAYADPNSSTTNSWAWYYVLCSVDQEFLDKGLLIRRPLVRNP